MNTENNTDFGEDFCYISYGIKCKFMRFLDFWSNPICVKFIKDVDKNALFKALDLNEESRVLRCDDCKKYTKKQILRMKED